MKQKENYNLVISHTNVVTMEENQHLKDTVVDVWRFLTPSPGEKMTDEEGRPSSQWMEFVSQKPVPLEDFQQWVNTLLEFQSQIQTEKYQLITMEMLRNKDNFKPLADELDLEHFKMSLMRMRTTSYVEITVLFLLAALLSIQQHMDEKNDTS